MDVRSVTRRVSIDVCFKIVRSTEISPDAGSYDGLFA